MRKIRALFIIVAILGLAVLGLPILAQENNGATLSLSPSADNFIVDSEFDVAVILDTGGQAINVIDVIVYFPEDLIEVVGSPTRDGLLPLWQFNASNEKGEINIVGGERQNGVVASNSEITRIKFKVKKEGKAVLKVSGKNSIIIAADGFGTKIPITVGQAYYSLTIEARPQVTPEPVLSPIEVKSQVTPQVTSPPAEKLEAVIFNYDDIRSIIFIIQTNFAGLLVALVAVVFQSFRKQKEVNKK